MVDSKATVELDDKASIKTSRSYYFRAKPVKIVDTSEITCGTIPIVGWMECRDDAS